MKLSRALAWILSAPSDISPIPDLAAWWRGHVALAADDAITRAALGGFAADRFAYAFASGYQAALERLTGGPPHVRRSLCATEERGAHPRAIACALREEEDGARLRGEKRWASLGAEADELLVVAQAARQRGPRPELVVVALPSARAGVRFDALPPTPFTPEVPHARVRFDDVLVRAADLLPGDGYADYLKPFRTIEDCFVHTALVAHWIRITRAAGGARELLEELAAALVGVAALATMEPRDPAVHVALAGALARVASTRERVGAAAARLGAESRARWERDQPLLAIASGAREGRRAAAWGRLVTP